MIIKASELKVNALFINGNYKKAVLAKSVEHVNCPINGNIVVIGLENGKSVFVPADEKIYDVTDTGNLTKSSGYQGFPEYVPATQIKESCQVKTVPIEKRVRGRVYRDSDGINRRWVG